MNLQRDMSSVREDKIVDKKGGHLPGLGRNSSRGKEVRNSIIASGFVLEESFSRLNYPIQSESK
jgi:hypothetical protein